MGNHEHIDCEHELAYCRECKVVYCKKCKEEWKSKEKIVMLMQSCGKKSICSPWDQLI